MAAEKLRLEIVTQKGVALSEEVDELIAPSVSGEFGVLPGHRPMLAALRVGLVRYRKPGADATTDVAVGAGFVEVCRDKALILTDRFCLKDAVEVLEVRARLKQVDEQIESWRGDLHAPERLGWIEEEQWLAALLELYGDPPVARVLEHRRAQDYSKLLLMPPAPEPIAEEHKGEPVGIIEDPVARE